MLAWLLLALLLLLLVSWPHAGLWARWKAWRHRLEQQLQEDVLKHVWRMTREGNQATIEGVAGATGIGRGRLLPRLARMEREGWLACHGTTLGLTKAGEQRAVQLVRAHRLWERYLADEARLDWEMVHAEAERAEHRLTPEQVAQLEAHMGYPRRDPHGDPILGPEGEVEEEGRTPLTEWEINKKARIVHVEDEPLEAFQQALHAKLYPGKIIQIEQRSPDAIVVTDGQTRSSLPPVVAANIHVAPATGQEMQLPASAVRLSELPDGRQARIVGLDPQFRGFARRRLLDLGFTPGALVKAELPNTFGDPRGYRIRGTLIALRNDQAAHIWVLPVERDEQEGDAATSNGVGAS